MTAQLEVCPLDPAPKKGCGLDSFKLIHLWMVLAIPVTSARLNPKPFGLVTETRLSGEMYAERGLFHGSSTLDPQKLIVWKAKKFWLQIRASFPKDKSLMKPSKNVNRIE